jgi:hypothetical protein
MRILSCSSAGLRRHHLNQTIMNKKPIEFNNRP